MPRPREWVQESWKVRAHIPSYSQTAGFYLVLVAILKAVGKGMMGDIPTCSANTTYPTGIPPSQIPRPICHSDVFIRDEGEWVML